MKMKFLLCAVAFFLSQQAFCFDYDSYLKNLRVGAGNTPAEVTVLGILDACNTTKMDANCAVPQLTQIASTNPLAQSIVSEYGRTQAEGKFNSVEECRIQKFQDTNNVLGACVLVMNYFALKEQSKDVGMSQFQTCVQGGLITLAYDGNLSAQFLLSQIFKGREMARSADVWEKSLEYKKGTEEDLLVRKCYS